MIRTASSSGTSKIPMPDHPLSSTTGHTITSRPSARSEWLRRPCSQMILPASGSEYLAPLLSNTSEYPRALPRISRMNSSVMSATPQGSQRSLQRRYMTGPPARSMAEAERHVFGRRRINHDKRQRPPSDPWSHWYGSSHSLADLGDYGGAGGVRWWYQAGPARGYHMCRAEERGRSGLRAQSGCSTRHAF